MEKLSNDINSLGIVSKENLLRESFSCLSEETKIELFMRFMKSNSNDSIPQSQQNLSVEQKENIAKKVAYPLQVKKDAVRIAIEKNNNREAAREIRAMYKDAQL